MFSNVGNIYTIQTGVRSTEKTDASLKMQHQQPVFGKENQYKPKKEHRGSNTTILPGKEQGAIPIDTIHNFLATIVQSKTTTQQNSNEPDFIPSLFDTIENDQLNKIRRRYRVAKAVNAYQQAANAGQNSNIYNIDRSNKSSLGLEKISNSELYTLIKDVETLRKQGLQDIKIQKNNSFLESLLIAIDDAKAKRKSSPEQL